MLHWELFYELSHLLLLFHPRFPYRSDLNAQFDVHSQHIRLHSCHFDFKRIKTPKILKSFVFFAENVFSTILEFDGPSEL